jgi:VIT1/CCC1 family predicted Fe2+/Mn2+ transporter
LEEVQLLIEEEPQKAMEMVNKVLNPYGFPVSTLDSVTMHLATVDNLDEFLMKHHHCKEEPEVDRAFISAFTIASGYFVGGLVPLAPYPFADSILEGLYISFGVMVLALFIFGYGKTCVLQGWNGRKNVWAGLMGGAQMVFVGGVAAVCAMALVKYWSPEGQASNTSTMSL